MALFALCLQFCGATLLGDGSPSQVSYRIWLAGCTFFLLSQALQGLLLGYGYQGSRHQGFMVLCQFAEGARQTHGQAHRCELPLKTLAIDWCLTLDVSGARVRFRTRHKLEYWDKPSR